MDWVIFGLKEVKGEVLQLHEFIDDDTILEYDDEWEIQGSDEDKHWISLELGENDVIHESDDDKGKKEKELDDTWLKHELGEVQLDCEWTIPELDDERVIPELNDGWLLNEVDDDTESGEELEDDWEIPELGVGACEIILELDEDWE